MMKDFLLPAAAFGALGALAVFAVQARAQDSAWGYFEAEGQPLQAGVVTADGGQLILKCDKQGRNSVFAVVVSPRRLRPASDGPQVRSIWLTYDGGPRREDRWRYNETTVLALNTSRDRTLVQFLRDLADAQNLQMRLEPTDGLPFNLEFRVAGAREAIGRVFESCKDQTVLLD